MKRTEILGLALTAMFAIGATLTSIAVAAAPEFAPSTTQKFTDKEGITVLTAPGEIKITCQSDTSKGEITGPKTVGKLAVTFKECKARKKTEECSARSPESSGIGIITTEKLKTNKANPLRGELGTTTIGTKVGEALQPETGEIFTEIEGTCIVKTFIAGSVIGEVKPVGTSQLISELIFRAAPVGTTKQEIKSCSGGSVIILCDGEEDVLEAFGGSVSFESSDQIRFEKPVEVT
jgi:hypothetical protein